MHGSVYDEGYDGSSSVFLSNLTDEAGGAALSHPQAELPLLPLAQLPLCACGDEHRVLIDQGLVQNLRNSTNVCHTER